MIHTKFKHVGKAYSVKRNDTVLCLNTGNKYNVVNVSNDYIFTLSNGANHTANQLYNLVNG